MCKKIVLWNANYDCGNNDYMNAYLLVAINGVIFQQISYDIIPYAQHYLPVRFFLKYSFNKLCFQLPQNMTWTDEQHVWLAQVQVYM